MLVEGHPGCTSFYIFSACFVLLSMDCVHVHVALDPYRGLPGKILPFLFDVHVNWKFYYILAHHVYTDACGMSLCPLVVVDEMDKRLEDTCHANQYTVVPLF